MTTVQHRGKKVTAESFGDAMATEVVTAKEIEVRAMEVWRDNMVAFGRSPSTGEIVAEARKHIITKCSNPGRETEYLIKGEWRKATRALIRGGK